MEEIKEGLVKERLGCHYCTSTFASQESRANHHKFMHKNKHKWMKRHRKSPDYLCKYCHIGFGSRQSRWNHQQRCQSNPEIIKQLKIMKKVNQRIIEEDLKHFIEEIPKNNDDEEEDEEEDD